MWTIFKVFIEFITVQLLLYALIFLAMRHVRSQLPDQGSNPHPLHWKVHSFWLIQFYLFIFIFGCAGPLLLRAGFLQLRYMGLSLKWLLLLWSMGSRCVGFSSCDSWTQLPSKVRNLPGAGTEPMCPHCKADS